MKQWIDVCDQSDLQPDSGVCVLAGSEQIALFYLTELDQIFAVGNFDPLAKVNVLSRSMVGDLGGEPMLASPLYKEHFSLRTGQCFEKPELSIPVYSVKIDAGRVMLYLN